MFACLAHRDAPLTRHPRHSALDILRPERRMDTTESNMTNLFLQLGLPAEKAEIMADLEKLLEFFENLK